MRSSIFIAVPVMILLAIGQTAVLPRLPLFGVAPQLSFLVALAWGLLNGRKGGMIWAFTAGVFMDIFSISPMGLTALVYLAAVTAVLLVQEAFPTSRVIMPLLLTALATVIEMILYLLALRLLGVITSFQTLTSLPTLIIVNTIAMLPVYWIMYSLQRTIRPRRIHL